MSPKPLTPAAAKEMPAPAPPVRELRSAAFRLSLPPGWNDRSIHCAARSTTEGLPLTITVVTAQMPPDMGISAYAEDQMRQLAGQLEDFAEIKSELRILGARKCHFAQFSWKSSSGPVRQSQWTVPHGTLAYTITATSPLDASREVDAQLASIVATFGPVS